MNSGCEMRVARLGLVVAAGFTIACASSVFTVTAGAVRVTVSATGESRDTIFTVTVGTDTASYQTHADSVLWFTLEEGSYGIRLTNVADNCSVEGDNPREVDVTAGQEVLVAFAVACATNGYAKVTIATTGVDMDDMYTLAFNGDFRRVLVGPMQFVTVSLPVGAYSVELTGVAANCTVAGDNPVSFAVSAEALAEASFSVACVAK